MNEQIVHTKITHTFIIDINTKLYFSSLIFFFFFAKRIILLNNNLSTTSFLPDRFFVYRLTIVVRWFVHMVPSFFPPRFPWRNEIKLPCIFGAKPRLAFATNFNPSYTLLAVAHHAQYDLRDVAGLVTRFPSVP